MTTQPIGPQSAGSSSHWYASSPTCNRSYLLAGLRAGLIAMPTAGQKGFLDALRGSTTERVVAQARCPVLAVPV